MRSSLTVTTAAASGVFMTPDDLRAVIDTDAGETKIAQWIAAASGVLVALLNFPNVSGDPFPLAQQTYDETFNLGASARPYDLRLSRKPLRSITSITVNGTALDAAQYRADNDEALIRYASGSWDGPWPCGEIVVTYVAGYVLSGDGVNFPEALKHAAAILVERIVAPSSGEICERIKSESFPGIYSATYETMPADIRDGVPVVVSRLLSGYGFPYPS